MLLLLLLQLLLLLLLQVCEGLAVLSLHAGHSGSIVLPCCMQLCLQALSLDLAVPHFMSAVKVLC